VLALPGREETLRMKKLAHKLAPYLVNVPPYFLAVGQVTVGFILPFLIGFVVFGRNIPLAVALWVLLFPLYFIYMTAVDEAKLLRGYFRE
jgi:hypothetical protein